MLRRLTNWPKLPDQHSVELTDAQRRAYKLEKVTNFRWVAQHLGKRSNYVLTASDRASAELQERLSQIGQFAEAAFGLYDTEFVWSHLNLLTRPNYPLERHDALRDTRLLVALRGRFAGVTGIMAYREKQKQLIVAFSGTYNFAQTLHDLNAFSVKYPGTRASGGSQPGSGKPKVHAGFWRLYRGVRRSALEALSENLSREKDLDIKEIIVTGHSLGGALSSFFLMDLLNPDSCSKYLGGRRIDIPIDTSLTVALFGAPRPGNSSFAELYQVSVAKFRAERGDGKFAEFLVKAHNDGVPALPPYSFGYRHAINSTLHVFHGRLYRIPLSESECLKFSSAPEEAGDGSSKPLYPLGGHNYYNDRDLETLARRMGWIKITEAKDFADDWERIYIEKLEEERRALEGTKRRKSRKKKTDSGKDAGMDKGQD
ncbi:hypothetical protein M0805_007965 [Coniferiporia weirii]|nr:hypothetical protein M0805_007965 [Coniferiporia weirii]